jgi:hypothetical protein
VLLFNGELITNISYYRKGLEEVENNPQEIALYLKEKGFSIDVHFYDAKHNTYLWCEQSNRYDNMLPDLLGLLTVQESEHANGDSEAIIKDTINDFYSLFAVNIGDDFLFSYLVGNIVKLVGAEVGLLQVVSDSKVSNFSMGFSPASIEHIRYRGKPLPDYVMETRQTLFMSDTAGDPDLEIESSQAGISSPSSARRSSTRATLSLSFSL